MRVKLSLEEFDDDLDVVSILDRFLKTSGLDAGTRHDAKIKSWMRLQSGSSGLRMWT